MKTVRPVPKRPRESSNSIVHPSCEKYFPTKFHNFCAKYTKEHEHYELKIYDQYFKKTVKEVPGRPHEGPKTVVQSSSEKYFPTRFHYFRAK